MNFSLVFIPCSVYLTTEPFSQREKLETTISRIILLEIYLRVSIPSRDIVLFRNIRQAAVEMDPADIACRPISPASLTSAFSISRIVRERWTKGDAAKRRKTGEGERYTGTYVGTGWRGWDGKPGRFSSRLTTAAGMYRCRHTHPLVCCCIKLQRCSAAASLVSSVSAVRMSAGQLINANHPKDCLCSCRSLRFMPYRRLFPRRHLHLQSPINYAGFRWATSGFAGASKTHAKKIPRVLFRKTLLYQKDTSEITYGKCLFFPLKFIA